MLFNGFDKDSAAQARLTTAWLWSGPLLLALALYWPIFLPGYRLDGGFANEILMVNGIRTAFNHALLGGEFPLWNEWVAGGKPFLIFGAVPFTFMTPFELVFGPAVTQTLYKFELVAAAAIGAAIFLWLGRALSLHPLAAAFGFLSCYVMGQMPYQTGLIQSACIYLWGAAAVATVCLYYSTGDRRLIALFLLFALLAATGARPDAFPLLLLFLGSLVGIRFLESFFDTSGGRMRALRNFGQEFFVFAVLPLAFYVWQLPFILSLAKTAAARLWVSPASPWEIVEYSATAIRVSWGVRIIACGLLGLMAINLARIVARRRFYAQVAGKPPDLLVILGVMATSALVLASAVALYFVPPLTRAITIAALVAMLLRVALQHSGVSSQWAGRGFWERLREQIAWRHAWLWLSAVAGVSCALAEDPQMTQADVEIPLLLKVAFLVAVFYAVGLASSRDNPVMSRLSRYLSIALGLGWFWRDVASIPLFYLGNIVWAVPRDMFWFVPCLSILFAIGCHCAVYDWRLRIASLAPDDNSLLGARRMGAALAVAVGLLSFFASYQALSLFYVPAGSKHRNEVWRHLNESELQTVRERSIQRQRLNQQALVNCGPDARILILPFPEIGFPGAEAADGVRNAWGYDFVNDYYRALAEAAFGLPLSLTASSISTPRLYFYSTIGGRVFSRLKDRFPHLAESELLYARYQMLANGPRAEPFFLQLMGVCGLMVYRSLDRFESFDVHLTERWGGNKTYVVKPDRQPRRYAFIAAEPEDRDQLVQSLGGLDQPTLQALYSRVRFEGTEASRARIEIVREDVRSDRATLKVTTPVAGVLLNFEAWDPNWKAAVNGAATPVERAFVSMRAVPVGAGDSKVVLRYTPRGFIIAIAGTLVALVASIGLALGVLLRSRRPQFGSTVS